MSDFVGAGQLDQKERAAAAELAKRQHLQADLEHRSKMHEEHQAMVAQERALRSEQNAEVSTRSCMSTDQFNFWCRLRVPADVLSGCKPSESKA